MLLARRAAAAVAVTLLSASCADGQGATSSVWSTQDVSTRGFPGDPYTGLQIAWPLPDPLCPDNDYFMHVGSHTGEDVAVAGRAPAGGGGGRVHRVGSRVCMCMRGCRDPAAPHPSTPRPHLTYIKHSFDESELHAPVDAMSGMKACASALGMCIN